MPTTSRNDFPKPRAFELGVAKKARTIQSGEMLLHFVPGCFATVWLASLARRSSIVFRIRHF